MFLPNYLCHIPEDCNVTQSYNAVYSEDKKPLLLRIINWDCKAEYWYNTDNTQLLSFKEEEGCELGVFIWPEMMMISSVTIYIPCFLPLVTQSSFKIIYIDLFVTSIV